MRFPPLKPGTIAYAAAKDGPRLTPAQRRALHVLTGQAAHVIAPGRTLERRQVSYAVAEQLVVAGYARPLPRDPDVHPPHGAIVITTAGRKALGRPAQEEPPVFLRVRDGLTTRMGSRAQGEPEVIDRRTLDPWWDEQALLRKALAEDRRAAAAKLARKARAA